MTPSNQHPTNSASRTARARSAQNPEDSAILGAMIEKNRSIINQGWEELARLTRMLDALDAREASIVRNDLNPPPPRSQPVQSEISVV